MSVMRFAYSDPPYLGCASFYKELHPEWAKWDDPETHRQHIAWLADEYPDGWAMSLSSPSLRTILPMCPDDCRVLAWVKPFASFKPNVGLAYAWEPVIFRGGRTRARHEDTTRDWAAISITLRKGLTGAKPPAFVHWLLDAFNARLGDQVDDLFPGAGGVSDVIAGRLQRTMPQRGLFDQAAA